MPFYIYSSKYGPHSPGSSLLECLIAITISSVLLLVLLNTLRQVRQTQQRAKQWLHAQRVALLWRSVLQRELSHAMHWGFSAGHLQIFTPQGIHTFWTAPSKKTQSGLWIQLPHRTPQMLFSGVRALRCDSVRCCLDLFEVGMTACHPGST